MNYIIVTISAGSAPSESAALTCAAKFAQIVLPCPIQKMPVAKLFKFKILFQAFSDWREKRCFDMADSSPLESTAVNFTLLEIRILHLPINRCRIYNNIVEVCLFPPNSSIDNDSLS